MRTKRLLLPFTHDVDMYALEYAVHLAKNNEAELIVASLIPCAQESRKAIRLEQIQQLRDFEVALGNKAENYGVPMHYVEVVTRNVIQEINYLAQKHECEGIVLFVRAGRGILLQTREIKHLLIEAICKLYIVRLPSGEGRKVLQGMIKDFVLRLGRRPKDDSETAERILFSNIPETAGENYLIKAYAGMLLS